MKEVLEGILERYLFEFNTEETRNEIKAVMTNYLLHEQANRRLHNFRIEDRTMLNNGDFNFQVLFQPFRTTEIRIIDIVYGERGLKISNFENNIVGKRDIKRLEL